MDRLLVWLLVGVAAQLIDGSMGMAYGVTSTTLLLGTGVTPALASASVHLAEVGTTLASGFSHWRFGNVDWRIVRNLGVPGAVGAFTGAVLLSTVSTEFARPWMAGILLALGAYILIRFSYGGTPIPRGRPYLRRRHLVPLGAVAGFVDASGGGGWGPVATPVLISTGKAEARVVIGSVSASEFMVSAAASIGFIAGLGTAGLDLQVVAALLLGGMVAAPIAAWTVRHLNPRVLGCSVGGLVMLVNARALFGVAGVGGAMRLVGYVVLIALWALAVARAIHNARAPLAAARK